EPLALVEPPAQELHSVEKNQVDGPAGILDLDHHAGLDNRKGDDGGAEYRVFPRLQFRDGSETGAVDIAPGQVINEIPELADPGLGQDLFPFGPYAGKPGQFGHGPKIGNCGRLKGRPGSISI